MIRTLALRALSVGALLALLACLFAPIVPATAAPPALPPRPMPGDDNSDDGGNGGSSGSGGAYAGQIVLTIRVSADDARNLAAWRAQWTVVQWQDGIGQWHDVDAWQGAPRGNPGDIVNQSYTIDERSYGKAPFRWVVRPARNAPESVASQPFSLPRSADDGVRVEVAVAFTPPTTAIVRVPGAAARAAALTSVLEWSEGSAQWYEVIGSAAPLEVADGAAAARAFRVPDALRGQGTFRFVIYSDRARGPVAVSAAFRMPAQAGQSVTVSAVLN